MKGAYRVALLCGAVPLVVGVSVFLLWLATRSELLMVAGALVLFFGLASFAVGTLALGRYCWLGFRSPDLPRRFWVSTLAAGVLLLTNFPAAGLILREVAAIGSRYTVLIRNNSPQALKEVHIVGRDRAYAFVASVAPGEVATRSFRLRHEGPLELQVAGTTTTIDGYVTADQGGFAAITIESNGRVSVELSSADAD